MIEFVRNAFRKFFTVLLWLIVIFFTIGGGTLANATYSVNSRTGTSSGVHPGFGAILGLLAGIFIVIIGGGYVATILNIDKNLEQLRLRGLGNGGENSTSYRGSANTPPVVHNTGDTWYCKKCSTSNPNNSPVCKGCGAYK